MGRPAQEVKSRWRWSEEEGAWGESVCCAYDAKETRKRWRRGRRGAAIPERADCMLPLRKVRRWPATKDPLQSDLSSRRSRLSAPASPNQASNRGPGGENGQAEGAAHRPHTRAPAPCHAQPTRPSAQRAVLPLALHTHSSQIDTETTIAATDLSRLSSNSRLQIQSFEFPFRTRWEWWTETGKCGAARGNLERYRVPRRWKLEA